MVTPNDLGAMFQTGWWSGFSQVGSWIGTIFLGLLVMGIFYALIQIIQYKVKVTYYPIQGDPGADTLTLGRPKNDRARRIKKRGIQYFRLLLARKTLKDIPYEMEYPDGVFLLRKSTDEFMPIPRPVLGNPSVVVQVIDPALQLWDQLRGQDIIKRFTDEDWQKKQMLIFAGVIIGCLIFSGVVIWMSYATSNSTLEHTDQLTAALNGLAQRMGISSPG